MTNIPLSDYMSGSFVGYTGSKGDIGYTGSQGYTGSKGDIGYTGSQGYTGSASTVIGYTGSKGDIGYTGSIPAALTATSLALGGATLGTNNLAVTGTMSLSGLLTAAGVSSTLTTDSTSATTGSIITAGGISTQKALWVGTTSRLVGTATTAAITASGTVTINAATALVINGATPSLNMTDTTWAVASYFQPGVNSGGTGTGDYFLYNVPTGKSHSWAVNNASKMILGSDGSLLVGTTTNAGAGFISAKGIKSDYQTSGWSTGQTLTFTQDTVGEPYTAILTLNSGIYASTGEVGMWLISRVGAQNTVTAIIANGNYTVTVNGSNQVTIENASGGNRTMYATLVRII